MVNRQFEERPGISPHSKNKKYSQAPFMVLQFVTNRGFMSVPERTIQGWVQQLVPGGPQYSYHGLSRYWLVLPGTEISPLFAISWSTKIGAWKYFFFLECMPGNLISFFIMQMGGALLGNCGSLVGIVRALGHCFGQVSFFYELGHQKTKNGPSHGSLY